MQKAIETNNATKGMDLKNGKRHYDSNGNPLGGIKAKVINSDNQQIEVEMGEVIITRDAVSNPKKYKIEGTTKEILSTLNQEGGGVPINETEAEILSKYRKGGELIKRADGSYSRRGLYDNIRDNIGSGKKPTKQMLEQEAKIKEKYHLGGDMSKHLAPNGKLSNLTHEQWHLVRTPEFKAWFGDWESEYILNEISNPNTAIKFIDNLLPIKSDRVLNFPLVQRLMLGLAHNDEVLGSIVSFLPVNVVNSITGQNIPTNKIRGNLSMFKHALNSPISNNNVLSLEQAVARFTTKLSDFFNRRSNHIPFTTLNTKDLNLFVMGGLSAFESVTYFNGGNRDVKLSRAISATKPSLSEGLRSKNNATKFTSLFDNYLLSSHNKNYYDKNNKKLLVSQIKDENGEPLVVYHGTNEKFNTFDLKSISSNTGNYGHYGYGFYFSDDIEETKTYGDIVLTCFLNFRKPFTHSKENFILLKENGAYWIDDLEDVAFDKDDLIKKLSKVSLPASELIRLITENGYSEGWGIWAEKYGNINSEIDFNEISDLLDGYSDSNKEYLESIGVENVKTIKDFPQEQTLHWITELGERSKEVTEIMSKIGFDSVIYGSEYVALYPNQIKLADGSNTTFDANNDDIRYREGGNISNMTPSELKEFYASPEGKKLDAETYSEWKRLVNMSKTELENFYNSEEGKKAGLTTSQAKEQGIDSGRESARWVMKMKDIPYKEWTSDMWRWAKKQINFIKRMSGMRGSLYNDKGEKTRKHTALLIWGHNPETKFEGGGVPKDAFEKSENERNEDYEGNWNFWIDTLLKNIDLPIEWTTSESRKELYGDSFYITIFNEDWQEFAKLRFSGHSVTNTSRLQNEFHNPNISRFYEIVSRAMNKGQQDKHPEKLVRFKGGGELSKKALAVETNDLTDFVRKYFIKDGRIDVSDAMQELFGNKRGKSIADEYRKRIGLHKKGGLTISELAHKLWEEHKDEVRSGVDDSDFREAVEDVISSEYGVANMIKSLMEKSEEGIEDEEAKFWANQFDENEYSSDDEQLTDEEMSMIFRDMEQAERELAKGTEHEMEHLDTLKKVSEGKITPEEGVVQTASTHIAENPQYYEDLAKMEKENEDVKFAFNYSEKELAKHITNSELDNFVKNAKFNSTAMAYNYPIPRRSGEDWHLYISIQKPSRMGSLHNKYWANLYKNTDEGDDVKLLHKSFDTLKEAKRFVGLNYYFETQRIYDVLEMEKENEESIPDLIEGLKVLAESLEGAEKKEIEDVIEGLEILLESDDKEVMEKKSDKIKVIFPNTDSGYDKDAQKFILDFVKRYKGAKLAKHADKDKNYELYVIYDNSYPSESEIYVTDSIEKAYNKSLDVDVRELNIVKAKKNNETIIYDYYNGDIFANYMGEKYDEKGDLKKEVKEKVINNIKRYFNRDWEGNLVEGSVLWATKIGEPDYNEQLITENSSQIENAKKWAMENGFDRIRVSKIDMSSKPDFTQGFKKYAEGGEFRMKKGGNIVFKPITTPL